MLIASGEACGKSENRLTLKVLLSERISENNHGQRYMKGEDSPRTENRLFQAGKKRRKSEAMVPEMEGARPYILAALLGGGKTPERDTFKKGSQHRCSQERPGLKGSERQNDKCHRDSLWAAMTKDQIGFPYPNDSARSWDWGPPRGWRFPGRTEVVFLVAQQKED